MHKSTKIKTVESLSRVECPKQVSLGSSALTTVISLAFIVESIEVQGAIK